MIPNKIPRREFLAGMAALTATTAVSRFAPTESSSPFRVAVINDEISQDFGHACEVTAREFGMQSIELRGMWKTDIASPLFKIDWPEAPKSEFSESNNFGANFTLQQQDEVLERSIEMAKAFGTDRVRCFDFWRLKDQAPYRAAINDKLREAAATAEKKNIILVLENEHACNTATAAEAAKVLNAVQSPSFMLNWDPGNAAAVGEIPYPDGYNLLPKERIGHCHCKDVVKKGGKYDWAAMGSGIIDWAGQFKALKRDGYHFAVSLETHWTGGGSPEESSRQSWAGMKKLLQGAGALSNS